HDGQRFAGGAQAVDRRLAVDGVGLAGNVELLFRLVIDGNRLVADRRHRVAVQADLAHQPAGDIPRETRSVLGLAGVRPGPSPPGADPHAVGARAVDGVAFDADVLYCKRVF